VPFNSFAEYAREPNPETKKKDVVWFALNDVRPLAGFAGIWTEFKGDRGTKSKPVTGPHLVYGFLTTSPNAIVEPIHPKAMPSLSSAYGRDPGPLSLRNEVCNSGSKWPSLIGTRCHSIAAGWVAQSNLIVSIAFGTY
jgi:hypothetical protein